ncbi:helix-turn-helix domain-containing protein [uncultured Actinomyces sp.]|uniref:helix-turn-helix domain-containing protein n=1 Tax=uncultured Actinomyces sp. TaxID=249061 RepID=UPI002613BFC2|nr:helix-turn-helix transcriptional regulator [uncultured Actinomyces sp.]
MTSVSDESLERRADLLVDARDRLLEDLVSLRKEHKLSQQTVAERMGVSQPTVAAFERYDANPTVSSIIRYAMAVDALLDIKVVDDCGEGVPATWQMSGAAQTTVCVPTSSRKTQAITNDWSVKQEPAHV